MCSAPHEKSSRATFPRGGGGPSLDAVLAPTSAFAGSADSNPHLMMRTLSYSKERGQGYARQTPPQGPSWTRYAQGEGSE